MRNVISFFTVYLFMCNTAVVYSQPIKYESMRTVLLTELKKHPHLQPDDIYKFIHLASFGSEHAVKDTAAARRWMENEIANLDYSIEDELIDTLSADGRIVRVNLRPYLKAGYDPELLLEAFVKTANNFKGSIETFKLYWNEAVKLAEEGSFICSIDDMEKLFVEMSARGFPAVHHSTEYAEEYKPAYRVVDINYLCFLKKK